MCEEGARPTVDGAVAAHHRVREDEGAERVERAAEPVARVDLLARERHAVFEAQVLHVQRRARLRAQNLHAAVAVDNGGQLARLDAGARELPPTVLNERAGGGRLGAENLQRADHLRQRRRQLERAAAQPQGDSGVSAAYGRGQLERRAKCASAGLAARAPNVRPLRWHGDAVRALAKRHPSRGIVPDEPVF